MTARVARLRAASLAARPALTAERAVLLTRFYRAEDGRWSVPVLRARSFLTLCEQQTIYLGDEELIVGERGPAPKVVPTFPELTCHSVEDLQILNDRPLTHYDVAPEMLAAYEAEVIPYWRGRSLRDKIMAALGEEWLAAYDAGVFTEFMEQRAPGHTVLDDKIYHTGLRATQARIDATIAALDWSRDPEAWAKREQLQAMHLACEAVLTFARRHAALARDLAATAPEPRATELRQIAAVCDRVPAEAPTTFWEALQAYWFCHLAVITELNGWDSFSPGHLDQHLAPFYTADLAAGRLTRESAKELLGAFFVKFNNHPSPPKVGVTAAESGTYTDFANLNLGGLRSDGSDGSTPVTELLLEVIDELHLLQPSSNLQLSRKTPEAVLRQTLRVLRNGYGFPSIFNADAVVQEQLRQGKTLADARAGGCSGCVETGAFGKEAYILTGYFNLPKILELTLHNGWDPRRGRQLGPRTGDPATWPQGEALFSAFSAQFRHFLELKLAGNHCIEQIYARLMPAPFLSVLTDDCIARGCDYNAGGARYNNSYIQFVGIGSLTDSFAAIEALCFQQPELALADLVAHCDQDFAQAEPLRQRLATTLPKYGNDDEAADHWMRRTFDLLVASLDGRPNTKGGCYRVEMLPTTCHVYFGQVTGATPDGRHAGQPLSEGISPVQGADRRGPTAVVRSAAKMDHLLTGGTLLNLKLAPSLVADEAGLAAWAALVRGYFALDGHHLQFNVVTAEQLREAQRDPAAYRGLIVRVAGYSDYFCDLSEPLQNEIIARTAHEAF